MAKIRRPAITLVLAYLKFWAKLALIIHRPTIVGIAGSTGKSSVKQILFALMSGQTRVRAGYGNSETGLPLAILNLTSHGGTADWVKNLLLCPLKILNLRSVDYLILEMATDDPKPPKNMEYLLDIAQPDVAIHLNAQPVHTQQFAHALTDEQKQLPAERQVEYITQAIGFEDAKIITRSASRINIFNGNDSILTSMYLPIMAKNPHRSFMSFGDQETNDLRYQDYAVSAEGTSFAYKQGEQAIEAKLDGYVLPRHYQDAFAAAILATQALKLDLNQGLSQLAGQLHLPPSRSTILMGVNHSAIIDSTYNASTQSALDMLALAKLIKEQTGRPLVLLLGDMRELGDQAASEHAKVLQAIPGLADYFYAVGPLTKQFYIDALNSAPIKPQEMHWFETALQAGQYLKEHLPQNSLLLAKGSQNTIFLEEAIKMLLADPTEASKLCRQDPQWLNIKAAYFKDADQST